MPIKWNLVMNRYYLYFNIFIVLIIGSNEMIYPSNFIPANNPYIKYYGRWDFSDSLHPKHSWPGVYVYTEFTGKSIGIRIADKTSYYNVYIDGKLNMILHGDTAIDKDYIITDTLENSRHSFRLSRRNISFDEVFTFSGLILDDGAELLQPSPEPERRIEFIGDSYTAAESNEATVQELEWEARFPVTNIDKGFASVIANHYNAQYHTICRSGAGMLCDWQGNYELQLPQRFDRTLMDFSEPKWDFDKWIPNLVVICLGLNDYSGLKDSSGDVSNEKSFMFRKAYTDFIANIRSVYPGVKILAVAAYEKWIRTNVKKIVDEEKAAGANDVYYSQFDYFEGGYVAYGHPTVETHMKMADQIIKSIDTDKIFTADE